MGVHNKQRRAAKKKKAARAGRSAGRERFVAEPTPELARAALLEALAVVDGDLQAAVEIAEELIRPDAFLPPALTRAGLLDLLADLTASVVANGWGPSDLAHLVRRRLSDARLPTVLALLADEAARHPVDRVDGEWLEELAAAGLPVPVDLRDAATVGAALQVGALLATLPPIPALLPAPGILAAGPASSSGDAKMLAKARALLAKAESTEYDEEAEALTAKAQELISRHSLERLLAQSQDASSSEEATVARRIWLEPPYVFAKSMLVAAVADANHCRSVLTERLEFCTVIGPAADLAAVDVLATSLLVQAGAAMRRHGRQLDRSGTSRTRSFRQSFLVAFAARIGERLESTAQDSVQSTGRAGELVPVLQRQAERVDAATEAMFPHLVSRQAAIANAQGWAAGRAAADLARLDTEPALDRAAG